VGAVSGRLLIDSADGGVGGGVDAYWRLESLLRRVEARYDSCIGCSGAVYAIRRALYEPIPADTLLDDVEIPMRIAVQGYRVVYRQEAVAHDPQASEPGRESVRKRRTLAGNFQMLLRHPAWLLPWRNRLWWQLAVHKYLRLAAPFLMLAAFLLNLPLVHLAPGLAALILQVTFYALALAGMLLPRPRLKLLTLPAGFVFLNIMILRGLLDFATGQATATWKTVR
jgi:cellulose synthase/poly-beta-1,6-N-acetylglucosamine synthase-like glycosyltransferase